MLCWLETIGHAAGLYLIVTAECENPKWTSKMTQSWDFFSDHFNAYNFDIDCFAPVMTIEVNRIFVGYIKYFCSIHKSSIQHLEPLVGALLYQIKYIMIK